MNKKITIIIISLCVCIILAVAGIIVVILNSSESSGVSKVSASYNSNRNCTIAVDNVSGKPGDTVKLNVNIKNNPGIMAYLLKFSFKSDILEYSGYDKGDFLTDYNINAKDDTVTFINVEDNNVKKDGIIITLKFKIKEDAPEGENEITLSCDDGSICNYDEQSIKPVIVNGSISIKK